MNQWEDLKKLFIIAFLSSLVESDKVIFCFPLIRASEDGQQKTFHHADLPSRNFFFFLKLDHTNQWKNKKINFG